MFKNRIRKSDNGFTLIEIILVVSILVILGMTIVPNVYSLLTTLNINSAKERIVQDINYIQDYAITRHTNTWLEFDLNAGNYTIYAGPSLATRVLINDYKGEYSGTVPLQSLYQDIVINSADFDGNTTFSYDWWGTPSAGGAIVLNNATQINLSKITGYVY